MIRVLVIGQLPKEIGGNYTTGAANVVFELSKHSTKGVVCYTYGSNIKANIARTASNYTNQYIGYQFFILRILKNIILNPIRTIRNILHYHNVDHDNIFRYMFYEENIRQAIKLIQPNVIHIHSINNVSPTWFALDGKDIPLLLTCHGIFYRGEESDKYNRDRYKGNIEYVDAYTGLTQESCEEYEKILGVSRNKISVIPNGVDCHRFYFDELERAKIRNEMHVSEKTKVLITVASIQERKGQYAFIKLLEKLTCDFQYWLVGTGIDIPLIETYIRNNGLENKVKLLGYRKSDELYKYYSAADIYAHVSNKEGQALCEIEANATGLRTIVNAEIERTIPSLKNGDYFVYNPYSPDIRSIQSWIEKDESKRISRNNLDWDVIAEMYAMLYKKLNKKI